MANCGRKLEDYKILLNGQPVKKVTSTSLINVPFYKRLWWKFTTLLTSFRCRGSIKLTMSNDQFDGLFNAIKENSDADC